MAVAFSITCRLVFPDQVLLHLSKLAEHLGGGVRGFGDYRVLDVVFRSHDVRVSVHLAFRRFSLQPKQKATVNKKNSGIRSQLLMRVPHAFVTALIAADYTKFVRATVLASNQSM